MDKFTRIQLYEQARHMGIIGRSKMNKAELFRAVSRRKSKAKSKRSNNCKRFRKTKEPKCSDQSGCRWVTGTGCQGIRSTKKSKKKSTSRKKSHKSSRKRKCKYGMLKTPVIDPKTGRKRYCKLKPKKSKKKSKRTNKPLLTWKKITF